MHALRRYADLVKFEHSVFALPFAYAGSFLAAQGWPGWRAFVGITVAMVAVRTFAMTVNRLADLSFDRANPRTANRPLVTGEVSVAEARVIALVSAVVFVLACWWLNALVLALSPAALALAGGYSYAKRVTWLCHFWLGSVLGFAPLGGWLAVDPHFALAPVLLAIGVTFWVAGFDILYACQDVDFDRALGLRSVPAVFGIETSFALAAYSHVNTALFFVLAGFAAGAGWWYQGVVLAIGVVLAVEHKVIKPGDLTRINLAFFTLNGVVAICLFGGVLLDVVF